MTVFGILGILIFALGYIGITLEHPLRINKSAFALITGTTIWMLVAVADPSLIDEHMLETGYDIFGITVFLLCAMTLVEILVHYGLFDSIKAKITQYKLSTKQQFWILTIIVFFLSGIVDNLTATIVAIQIARKFFWDRNLLVAGVAIVVAANAGGSYSPIGDVNTIMLWVAGKFDSLTILINGFLPAILLFIVANIFLSRKIKNEISFEQTSEEFKLTRGRKIVIAVGLISFTLPIFANAFHLPPVLGIIFGVGITWFVIDMFKKVSNHVTHMTATIEKIIQKADLGLITFFIGILLAVSGLNTLGVLKEFSEFLYGTGESINRIIIGNIGLGFLSAVLDNIPLTAIAIKSLMTTDPHLWVLLAISVCNGGSLLAIGSASGVVSTTMISGLTFKEYFKIGFLPILTGFCTAILTWWIFFTMKF